MRDGTRSSDTTAAPRAASVGATAMASSAASTTVRPGRVRRAAPTPATIVNGSPMPSRRTGTASSRRRVRRSIRDASVNSTSASVDSAISRRVAPLGPTVNHPSTASPSTIPAVRNTIADVTIVRPRRRDTMA